MTSYLTADKIYCIVLCKLFKCLPTIPYQTNSDSNLTVLYCHWFLGFVLTIFSCTYKEQGEHKSYCKIRRWLLWGCLSQSIITTPVSISRNVLLFLSPLLRPLKLDCFHSREGQQTFARKLTVSPVNVMTMTWISIFRVVVFRDESLAQLHEMVVQYQQKQANSLFIQYYSLLRDADLCFYCVMCFRTKIGLG